MLDQDNRKTEENDSKEKVRIPAELQRIFISKKLKREELFLFSSFLIFISILTFGGQAGLFGQAVHKAQVLKESAIKQGRVVAGESVTWTKVVSLSAVNSQTKYVQLPELAQNVQIETGAMAEEAFLRQDAILSFEEKFQFAKAGATKPQESRESTLAGILNSLTSGLGSTVGALTQDSGQEIVEAPKFKFLDLYSAASVARGDLITVQYATPGPELKEDAIAGGKRMTVFDENKIGYRNVIVFTQLDKSVSFEDLSNLKLFQITGGQKQLDFEPIFAPDGRIYAIQWTIPFLSGEKYEAAYVRNMIPFDIKLLRGPQNELPY